MDALVEVFRDLDQVAVPIIVAAVLAGVIGFDREVRGKAAGLRTNIVVGVAAAGFAYAGANAFGSGGDPTRVAADIVSGVGFLGGGAIFAAGGKPHGLTTAAALWGSAAVGLAAGAEAYSLAVAMVAVTVVVLWPLERFSGALISGRFERDAALSLVIEDATVLRQLRDDLEANELSIVSLNVYEVGEHVAVQLVTYGSTDAVDAAVATIRQREGVVFVADQARD